MVEARFSALIGFLLFVLLALIQNGWVRVGLTSNVTVCIIAFVVGLACPSLTRRLLMVLLSQNGTTSSPSQHDQRNKIYSLKHGILNVDTSNITMWMNMGHWGDQHEPRDLPRACRSLLHALLVAANLNPDYAGPAPDLSTTSCSRRATVNIVDIGFGCGDQSMALKDMIDLGSYVGITLDRQQFERACARLEKQHFLVQPTKKTSLIRQIYHADAAKPGTWDAVIANAVNQCCQFTSCDAELNNWVLALDVMYHFSPSRRPFFRYAYQELQASIMAFDLLLPETSQRPLTIIETLLLRFVSLVSASPYCNFLTPTQYRAQLIAAGYLEHEIEIRDISVNVFGPLVEFMTWQDQQLKGLGMSIGAFHAARWLFDWWARTGIVRGCIVIARRKPTTKEDVDMPI